MLLEFCCPFQLLSYTKTLMSHSSTNTSEFCFYLRYVNACAILLTFINLQSTFMYSVAYVSPRMENCMHCFTDLRVQLRNHTRTCIRNFKFYI